MTRTRGSRLTIILLIDALGWDIARKFEFCRGILPWASPLDTVLGYSSAAIPSLLTGTPPSEHGAWAMYKYGPESSPFRFLRGLPRMPHAIEWRLRVAARWLLDKKRIIKGYYDLYDIPLNVLGYFDVAHHGDPYAPGGTKRESFFDRLSGDGVPYLLRTYRTPEAGNFEALREAIDSDRRVLFLYTADLDELMHRVGTTHDKVKEKLAYYEGWVKTLLDRASSIGRETTVFLFSDHGMTDVHAVVDLRREVDRWGYRMGRDFLGFYDSTMARFWCRRADRAVLSERLNGTGWGRVLSSEELEALGCRFDDDAYGEVIFLVHAGILIAPSFMSREPVAAMHGYHPADPSSRGCFYSNDREKRMPRSILDLKTLLLADAEEER
jgi:predicted AlkP superfamily pyrophosphatase or phosphodiesterase